MPHSMPARVPVVVRAPQQLVVATRTAMKTFLLAQLGLRTDVILDLSQTVSLDSSGLGMLISVDKSFRLAGQSFVLCSAQEDLMALFELTQVDRRIHIAPDIERAHDMLALPPLPDERPTPAHGRLLLHR